LVNIYPIDMKLPPFESSQRDESNKLKFVVIGSLDT